MTTTEQAVPGPQPVRFARRSSRGFLYGMSKSRLITVAIAIGLATLGLINGGPGGVVVLAPLWGTAAILAFVPVKGRKIIEWIPVVANWHWHKIGGQNRFRARPHKPRPAGTLALPGDAARLRILVDPETKTAVVHDPHLGTLTTVLRVSHGSFILVDPETQATRAEGWGRLLGGLASQDQGIIRVQILERALPDAGVDVAAWWAERGSDDGSWMASAYKELLATATPASEKHETFLSITLSMRAVSGTIREHGGGLRGAAAVLRQRMSSFENSIRNAELMPAGWLDEAGLAWVLRTAYDPESTQALEGKPVGKKAATAGPIAVDEEWDTLRSDSAHHTALWISEWPRVSVVPGFLWPMVLAPHVRRSLSIVLEPIPTTKALRDVRKERFDYMSDQLTRDKRGQITDYSQQQELEDVNKREQELVSGHGEFRYAAFLAVSAPTKEELAVAVDDISNAAIEAYCELRTLWGEQGTGFQAAALPLGRGV